MTGLILYGFSNTNCARKGGGIVPITNGDTQKTGTKIDSSGEDLHIAVTQGGVTTTGALGAGLAEVYLFNNFTDYEAYSNSGSLKSKYIDSAKTDDNGDCKIHVAARNCTGRYFPPSSGPYSALTYQYYCAAKWRDPNAKNRLNTGWYSQDGNCKDAALLTVSINNGLNNAGLSVPVGVSFP